MKILVAGATGRVGKYLVEQLHQAGHQVLALTRNPANAKANFPEGVDVVAGDLTQPETLAPLLEGVEGLHLIKFGGDNYEPLQTGDEIVVMAQKAGVKRVTVLMGGEKGEFEQAIESSSLTWTFLQPVEFMTGALDYAESIRAEGVVREPFADRKTAIVHEADIAAVGVAALTQNGHGGKTYAITGGEVLTPRKMVQIIGEIIGRDLQFIELSEAEARAKWQAEGIPAPVIEYFVWIYGHTPEVGTMIAPTVQEITGQTPRTFAQWVREHVDAFRVPSEAASKI